MSAENLRAAVNKRIAVAREQHIKALRRCKYHPAVVHKEGAVIPPMTCENIALFAAQTNASIEMLDGIRALIDEEFEKIMRPEQKTDPKEKKVVKEIY